MSKFLYFTDSHFVSRKPEKRIDDNFIEGQHIKLQFIVDAAIQQRCQAVIHGGDFFDGPGIDDYSLINPIITQMRRLKEAGIGAYVVPGSHDLYGYNVNSIHETVLGLFITAGLLNTFQGLTTICGQQFYGIPGTLNHTLDLYRGIPEGTIIVTHNVLIPERMPFDHVLFDEVAFCNNIFLCGHYHQPFQKKIGKNIFLNPGPIVRTSIKEAQHKPKVLLIDLSVTPPKFSALNCPYHMDAFDLRETATKQDDNTFTESLQKTSFDYYDIFDLTQKIAEKHGIGKTTTDQACERLNNAKKQLAG